MMVYTCKFSTQEVRVEGSGGVQGRFLFPGHLWLQETLSQDTKTPQHLGGRDRGPLWVQGQPDLSNKLQARQRYIVRCL